MSRGWGEDGWGEDGWGGGHDDPSDIGASGLDEIFSEHPCSVLGTGNNPDLLVYTKEAV